MAQSQDNIVTFVIGQRLFLHILYVAIGLNLILSMDLGGSMTFL